MHIHILTWIWSVSIYSIEKQRAVFLCTFRLGRGASHLVAILYATYPHRAIYKNWPINMTRWFLLLAKNALHSPSTGCSLPRMLRKQDYCLIVHNHQQ